METERSLSSFYAQLVFVSMHSLSFINTHICMYTKIRKNPLIWRLWKHFLISWNYPFRWVMSKQQLGLCLHTCLPITWLSPNFSLRLLCFLSFASSSIFVLLILRPKGIDDLLASVCKSQDASLLVEGTQHNLWPWSWLLLWPVTRTRLPVCYVYYPEHYEP